MSIAILSNHGYRRGPITFALCRYYYIDRTAEPLASAIFAPRAHCDLITTTIKTIMVAKAIRLQTRVMNLYIISRLNTAVTSGRNVIQAASITETRTVVDTTEGPIIGLQ